MSYEQITNIAPSSDFRDALRKEINFCPSPIGPAAHAEADCRRFG